MSTILIPEHTTVIDDKMIMHQHPITYVSGLFQGSQLNWTALTKEAYAIYMAVKKLSFYLADATITLQSKHLLLNIFSRKLY